MQTERSETRQAVIQRQHNHGAWLRSQLRLFRDQSDTVVRLSEQVTELRWHLKASEARKATLKERLVKLRATGATLSKLPSDAVAQLRTALRRSRRQKTTIKSLYKDNARLRRAARVSSTRKETLEVELARVRTISKTLSKTRSDEAAQLRKALRRSRRQKTTIKWLRTAKRPAAQDRAGIAEPQGGPERGVGEGSCESGRTVKVALRARERAAGQAALGAPARPATRRSRPWPYPATGA